MQDEENADFEVTRNRHDGAPGGLSRERPSAAIEQLPEHREAARLDALYQLKLLDTPASESFDRITRMASQIFGLPIAAMSLTDSDRQWFKSRVGLDHFSIPRPKAPCAEVAETARPLVIPDFLTHPRYADSGLAAAGIRFYAGAPLVTQDGHGLGSLCVLGTEPRRITEQELAALVDLAAMVMAQIELQHAFGRIDPLSGMPNRTQFIDDFDDLARDHAEQGRMAVLIDLARHEQINTLMHVMGAAYVDDIVSMSGQIIRAALHPDQTLYHVAATQFAFLSPPDVDEEAYMALLATALDRIRASSTVRFVTTVAIGVMPFRFGAADARHVLRGAYSAAESSRGTDAAIARYSASNDGAARRRYEIINAFGKALEQGDQLRMVFQPRIDLATRRCVGAEALLRWQHPTLGTVSPAEFIPVIEQTTLARPTTAWVLDASLAQLRAWNVAGLDLQLSLNISVSNLEEDGFADRVQLHLLKHRIPAAKLELEVTESAVMENSGKALAQLHALAAAGVRIAIDDFGTGYSSIAYLQKLPAYAVKIDQSFVRGLRADDERGRVLVGSMVTLSHQLGFSVVAEGVETAEAVDVLAQLGCEEVQGYFFARPLEASDLPAWVEACHRQPWSTAQVA